MLKNKIHSVKEEMSESNSERKERRKAEENEGTMSRIGHIHKNKDACIRPH
jgi:hypothetical protein